ncbi:3-ketodihydrosphingosine reductase-like [Pocillopora damicornis]|uniref:3-ketodihydrosphingosine reductase-like n=1 Tax=Pocillopora damicornis TaxID=46731 RepID=UPI000F558257|nr:3-ketodihydrosphingosine reductase-like [Pocillopora damicornis]
MLEWVIIATLACVSSLFLIEILNTKKTEINGAHAVVTGGSSGIGKALAIKLAKCGANVTIIARNMSRLEETLKEVKKHLAPERKVLALSVDLTTNAEDVENTLDQASEALGPIDILINCAGFAVCGLFEETSIEDFKAMINTNYLASVFTSHAVIKRMKQRRKGHLVFVSSIGGQFGIFGFTAYSPSKFAVRGFAETLFMEVKPYDIAVSVAFPPDTDTPGFENENKNKPEETHLISSSGGLFTPEQVASNIVVGIKDRRFMISCGFDGYVVSTLTAGLAPISSLMELLTQVILMGPLRFVLAFYLYYYDRIVFKGMQKREQSKKTE